MNNLKSTISQVIEENLISTEWSDAVNTEVKDLNLNSKDHPRKDLTKVPFITIYKMNFLNFFIVKMLVKIKFANIINIINNKEIIPELIQKECNAKEIYNSVVYFLKNPELMKKQINDCEETLTKIRSKTSSSDEASSVLTKFLIG